MVIDLVLAFLPGDDDVLIVGSKTIRKCLRIDVVSSLRDTAVPTRSRKDRDVRSSDQVTSAALARLHAEAMQ